MSKAKTAKAILKENAIMIESLLNSEEKQQFSKGQDFVSYLISLCEKEIREEVISATPVMSSEEFDKMMGRSPDFEKYPGCGYDRSWCG